MTTTKLLRVKPGEATVYSVEEVAVQEPDDDVQLAPIINPEGIVITMEVDADERVFLRVNGEVIVSETFEAVNKAIF
jgi:hypothetical protein